MVEQPIPELSLKALIIIVFAWTAKFNKGFLITNSLQAFVNRLGRGYRTIIGSNIFWCPASWKPIAQTKQNIISSDNPIDHKCSPALDNLAPDEVYYNHPHPFGRLPDASPI